MLIYHKLEPTNIKIVFSVTIIKEVYHEDLQAYKRELSGSSKWRCKIAIKLHKMILSKKYESDSRIDRQ